MDTEQCKGDKQKPKKCFCARCFMPIDPKDKVEIDGQHFHSHCSTCCICHKVPTCLKMFYGHVFCNECFNNYVMNRFKGDPATMYTNSWWLQWAPGVHAQSPEAVKPSAEADAELKVDPEPPTPMEETAAPKPPSKVETAKEPEKKESESPKTEKVEAEEPPKRCICARCLQPVGAHCKVEIGGQCFHPQCCRCCFCRCVPKDSVKIYYGNVFCEECFNKFVMARNKDTPPEHFRHSFEQWATNAQFAEKMQEMMAPSKEAAPTVIVMNGAQPAFCRCGKHSQQDWFPTEPRKSATPTPGSRSVADESFSTWELSFENRTEVSDLHDTRSRESASRSQEYEAAAEKIEKLTKYFKGNGSEEKISKKWENFIDGDSVPSAFPWVDLQDPKIVKDETSCPKCLWQCGSIYVNSEYMRKKCNEVNKVVS